MYTALQAVASPLGHSTECGSNGGLPPDAVPVPPSGRRDSNPRPQPWQGCALPAALRPHWCCSGVPPSVTRRLPFTGTGQGTLADAVWAHQTGSSPPRGYSSRPSLAQSWSTWACSSADRPGVVQHRRWRPPGVARRWPARRSGTGPASASRPRACQPGQPLRQRRLDYYHRVVILGRAGSRPAAGRRGLPPRPGRPPRSARAVRWATCGCTIAFRSASAAGSANTTEASRGPVQRPVVVQQVGAESVAARPPTPASPAPAPRGPADRNRSRWRRVRRTGRRRCSCRCRSRRSGRSARPPAASAGAGRGRRRPAVSAARIARATRNAGTRRPGIAGGGVQGRLGQRHQAAGRRGCRSAWRRR